mmetsp:Transcript_57818/g.152134  ORF Transcript_57818/g.152134 Transcript_57818/m.152134 type:complete len:216 (+) Transcript_57818:2024-2671(+)
MAAALLAAALQVPLPLLEPRPDEASAGLPGHRGGPQRPGPQGSKALLVEVVLGLDGGPAHARLAPAPPNRGRARGGLARVRHDPGPVRGADAGERNGLAGAPRHAALRAAAGLCRHAPGAPPCGLLAAAGALGAQHPGAPEGAHQPRLQSRPVAAAGGAVRPSGVRARLQQPPFVGVRARWRGPRRERLLGLRPRPDRIPALYLPGLEGPQHAFA